MERQVGDVAVHYVERGEGMPLLVLHGAGVDHREAEGCFEPALGAHGGLRRIYPDLPGMGRTPAPAARRAGRVAGLALVCPLLAGVRDVPEHHPVVLANDLGHEEFRSYFVVQTPAMLERYERFVAPAVPLVDAAAMERIGERWELTVAEGPAYGGPVLVVAGRQDSTVGYVAATDLLNHYPRATLAVLDGAGHALPHEQPELLTGLLQEWLARTGPNV